MHLRCFKGNRIQRIMSKVNVYHPSPYPSAKHTHLLHLIHQQSTPISFTLSISKAHPSPAPLWESCWLQKEWKKRIESQGFTPLYKIHVWYIWELLKFWLSVSKNTVAWDINHLIVHIMLPSVWTTLIQNLPTCWQQRVTCSFVFVIRTLAC